MSCSGATSPACSHSPAATCRKPQRSSASTARRCIGCVLRCPKIPQVGRTGTFTDKLLNHGELGGIVTALTSNCPNLPQTGRLPHVTVSSCKLHWISVLGVHMRHGGTWQRRCDRGGPTHERGHHERRRRNNPKQHTIQRFFLRPADATGDQYVWPPGSRSCRTNSILDQIGRCAVPRFLTLSSCRISPE